MGDLENKVDYTGLNVKQDLNQHVLNEAGIDLSPIDNMFADQTRINDEVDPEWKAKLLDWKTAILVEVAEGIDSTSWKWWKKGKNDWLNLAIEMIDAMFFINAKVLETNTQESAKIFFMNYMINDKNNPIVKPDLNQELAMKIKVELRDNFLRILSLDHYLALIPIWFKVWNMMGHDTTHLFKLYKLKFVLNMFRQKYGYKEGTYIKIWHGIEDNKVAVELASEINFDENYEENLWKALEDKYNTISKDVSNTQTVAKSYDEFLSKNAKYKMLNNAMSKEIQDLLKDFSEAYLEFNKQ
jgi:hypothetical protein